MIGKIKEWEENHLHTYKMKSPLDGREFFKGDFRSKDFNIWTKPKEVLEVPLSIFDAGTIKENAEKQTLL